MNVWPSRLMPLDVGGLQRNDDVSYSDVKSANRASVFVGRQYFIAKLRIALVASHELYPRSEVQRLKNVFVERFWKMGIEYVCDDLQSQAIIMFDGVKDIN